MPIFLLLSLTVAISESASAAANSTLNFQGRLATNTGGLVPDGSYNVEFRLYDVPTGGSSLWTETRTGGNAMTVRNGYFSVYLGDVTPFGTSIPWDQELWLTMNVNGDGEMSPRFKLTAVPYAFRAGAVTDAAGNAFTADQLAKLAPSTVQSVNAANAALRLNQTGSGALLQLQGDGNDRFVIDKTGGAVLGAGITVGNSTSTTAGTVRWNGSDLQVYNGSDWVSLTQGSSSSTTSASSITLASGILNLPGTSTATVAGILINTTNTAFSVAAATGSGTFTAAADGSFRSCVVVSNANRTAGTAALRWRVNGSSVGAGACEFNATNIRTSSSSLDSGVVTFSAGDEIGVAFDSSGYTPAGSAEFFIYWTIEYNSDNSTPSDAFVQGGNEFGSTAIIGTKDNFGLQIITNDTPALSITSSGDATFAQSLTVANGGISVNGNSTITGALDGLTGLTVVSGGATISGGINNNSGGITNAGSITGVGTDITASGSLTISSGAASALTLNSGSGLIIFEANTLQRTASGTTSLQLNDASDTTFSILNSNGSAVANLLVEGSITASIFSGDGSGLVDLDASNISSGLLSDGLLSSNVALLNSTQTFTNLNTFSAGLVVGNTGSATAGALRFNGSDFEGYDGSQWVSLSSGISGGGGNTTTVIKPANETVNNSSTLQNDDHLAFPVGSGESWAFRFVIQASSTSTANLQFEVTAPSGSVCRVAYASVSGGASDGQIGCGVTTGLIAGSGSTKMYEITGSVTTGSSSGTVRLRWSQHSAEASNSVVYAGSYVTANAESLFVAPPSTVFVQGGNTFGANAIIGASDAYGVELITSGVSRLIITDSGEATFTGALNIDGLSTFNDNVLINGDLTIGQNSTDSVTINSGSATIVNSLNINSGLLVIDSTNDRIGINNANADGTFRINTATTLDSAAEFVLSTATLANKGLVIQGVAGQTANLFEAQNSSGQALVVISASGVLGVGSAGVQNGVISFSNDTNANTISLTSGLATANRTISLPDADGALCLSGSAACGYVLFAQASAQTDASTNSSIFINKTGASGNILTMQRDGNGVFSIANNGAVSITNSSADAFTVSDASLNRYLTVDTVGGLVRVGGVTADATGILLVLDTKNTAGDPTGQNGGMYYNSVLGKMRCFENSRWIDCSTTRLQDDEVLTSPASSISVAVPDGVTSLRCTLNSPGVSTANLVYLRFNNVATGNPYSYNTLLNTTGANNNTSTVSSSGTNQIALSGTTNISGSASFDVTISNFASANKSVSWIGTREASGVPQRLNGSGVYLNTAGLITSVQFVTSAGTFDTGTRAWCQAR